jgi:hypothetical protein
MCWGFDHDDGWFNIIWDLSVAIERELNFTDYQMKKQMFLEWLSNKWNAIIYKLSPPHTEDFIAKMSRDPDALGLKRLVWWAPSMFSVGQVKEKYGTLRYYVDP